MRTWVLIAALAAVCSANYAENLSNKDIIRKTLRSWKPRSDLKFLDAISEPGFGIFEETDVNAFEDNHHISKRSIGNVLAGVPISRGCQRPGYTGETCQYPICQQRNGYIPSDLSQDEVSIDAVNLANCSESFVILVDETMWKIQIELESDSPLNPTFYLQSEDGSIIFPSTENARPTFYVATYEFLAPGQYLVGPRADTGDEYCTMLMSARTSLKLVGGFTSGYQSERNDMPNAKFAYFDTESTIVLRAIGQEFPTQIQGIGFTGAENHIYRYTPVETRYNCTYQYFLERYTCKRTSQNDLGHNFLQVEGVTSSGYKFRRIMPYQCVLPPVAPTTVVPVTPSPAPLTSCKNDGKLLTDANNQPYCYCFGLFGGADCSKLICANGGYLETPTSQRCKCPDGFTGFNCENIICTDNTDIEFDAEHPTLTLVIRTRSQLSNVIEQVVNATSSAISSLSFDPTYLQNFIVVLFDNNKILLSKRYDSFDKALVDLYKAVHTAPSDGGCEDSVFSAISAALAQYPNNKSPVYIVTDANPNDSAEKETVYNLESYWRSPLFFLYVQPAPGDGCTGMPDSPGYRDYVDLSTRTSGNTFFFNDRSSIYKFMYQHLMDTLYRSQLLLSADYTHCGRQNMYKTIAVDQDTDMLIVVVTGKDTLLIATDPFGNKVDFTSNFDDGQNHIWSKPGVVSGTWFITLFGGHESDACSFRAYQKKFNTPGSKDFSNDYDIFWAFTTSLAQDGNLRQPVRGFDASPVFHVTNYPQWLTMDRVHAALQIYAVRDGNQTEVYGSNGMWRDACSLNFYFPPFTCQIGEETLYFNFYASDRAGMTMQRAGTMYCSIVHPTPPPDHQCQNGGVMNPSNTTCFCTPEFSGQYCQNVVCFNGGTSHGDHCDCPPGYAGKSCEMARCTEKGVTPEFMRQYVDMVFAVETTMQSFASLVYLQQNFEEILRDVILQNNKWIRSFVLVSFNSTWGGVVARSPASDITQVSLALANLAKTVPSDTGCRVKLWDALNAVVFSDQIAPGSYFEIFQTSPEDDTDARSLGLYYDMSRRLDLINYGFLASSPRNKPEGFFCNATVEDYYTLLGIVSGSTGNTYIMQPAEISNAVRLIPLQYSNGVVHFNNEPDCRFDGGMTTYFPIDAYAQTIQLDVFGFNANISVFDGQGNPQQALQLFRDDSTGMSVYEIRKACDPGWEPLGQYCVKFVAGDDALPMPDAKKFCAAAGGFLMDDLTTDKNDFLYNNAAKTQFWIGLFSNNNGYMWDRGNSDPTPLSGLTFWSTGTAPPVDDHLQCVYFDGRAPDKTKTWTPESCSTPLPFACQKHRYDIEHRPNKIGDDDLPAGMWYAKIQTTVVGDSSPVCSLLVRVQSDLQIYTGYTTNIGSDIPDVDPIQDSKANRLITYIHSVDNQNRAPILTDAVLWDTQSGVFQNGVKYQPRFGCSYGWATQDFPCPNGDEFGVAHIGEDEFGHTFQRVTFGHCSKATIECGNGGVRSNGACFCNDYWTGSQCTVPICVNNGTRNADERTCTCPAGYTGLNCQYEMCQPIVPTLFSDNSKTLVLVVEMTKQNNPTVDQLINQLNSVVSNVLGMNPMWFNNYALVTFDFNGVSFEKYDYTSIQAVTLALISAQARITDQGACSMPIFGTLIQVMQHTDQIVNPDSQIFMFTTGGTNDMAKVTDLSNTLYNSEAHFHYIYSKSANCAPFEIVNGVTDVAKVAYSSGGNVLFTEPAVVMPLFMNYLPSLYGASVLADPTGHRNFDCSSGDPWYIPVDINTTYIYASTTSEFGTLSVLDPKGQEHAANVFYNVDSQKLYAIEVDRIAGIWTLRLTNPPGLCFAHIYSVGGARVYTHFALTSGVGKITDPTGAHSDGLLVQPVPGVPNIGTFQLVGAPFHRGRLQYIEIYDPANVQNILRSELYPRAECSYQYYSDPFTCDSDLLAIFIYGVDETNQKFRRQQIVVCNGQTPDTPMPFTVGTASTQTPAVPTTQQPGQPTQKTQAPLTNAPATSGPTPAPGLTTTVAQATTTSYGYPNMPIDIVFLIDGSQAAKSYFDTFTKFVQTFMISFTISTSNAHVGILVVTSDQQPAVANLNAITSQDSLNSMLRSLGKDYANFDQAGQQLNFNLQVASSNEYTSKDSGYRSNINNHLIVYLTATTAFADDPNNTAKNILTNKQYGIISIGYGPAVDGAKLAAVSGGNTCAFTAVDVPSLNNLIVPIQQQIWNAGMNGGAYCPGQ